MKPNYCLVLQYCESNDPRTTERSTRTRVGSLQLLQVVPGTGTHLSTNGSDKVSLF